MKLQVADFNGVKRTDLPRLLAAMEEYYGQEVPKDCVRLLNELPEDQLQGAVAMLSTLLGDL